MIGDVNMRRSDVMCSYALIGNSGKYPKSCSFAITVERDMNSDCVLFHKLGFLNSDEYVNNYPGKFVKKSNTTRKLIGRGNRQLKPYISDNNVVPLDRGTSISFSGYSYEFLINKFPFITPTLDEMSKMIKRYKLEYDRLWFCSDWTDDLGES